MNWSGLCSVGMVQATREIQARTSTEVRYFISSLAGDSAQKFAHAVRSHWSVENSLHWVLDMAFDEDQSRVRTGNAAENMAMLRHVAWRSTCSRATRRRATWASRRVEKRPAGAATSCFTCSASRRPTSQTASAVKAGRTGKLDEPLFCGLVG